MTLLAPRKGTAHIVIDYSVLSQQSDPVQFLVDQVASEVALANDYSASEVAFVKQGETLRRSAKVVYMKIRARANAVPFDQYRAQRKGREFTAPPTTYRATLHYDRPGTRGRMEREVP